MEAGISCPAVVVVLLSIFFSFSFNIICLLFSPFTFPSLFHVSSFLFSFSSTTSIQFQFRRAICNTYYSFLF